MAEKFRNFYIEHVPRQQNACAHALASLVGSLALLARAAEKVLVYSYDLYCSKLFIEDDQISAGNLQVKETLETSAGLEFRDWGFPYIDMHCKAFCPITLKRQLPFEGKPLNSTTM